MPDHVLVVEPHAKTRQAICDLLNRAGLTTRIATTVVEAKAELGRSPSLIVVNMLLPDGSGVDVLDAIRTAASPGSVAVICSGNDAPSNDWMAQYKPDAVFGKPFDFEDFADWLGTSDTELETIADDSPIRERHEAFELAGSVG